MDGASVDSFFKDNKIYEFIEKSYGALHTQSPENLVLDIDKYVSSREWRKRAKMDESYDLPTPGSEYKKKQKYIHFIYICDKIPIKNYTRRSNTKLNNMIYILI